MTSQLNGHDRDIFRTQSAVALIELFPDLALHLAQPCVTVPILENGTIIDIGMGDGFYYGGNALEISQGQVKEFCDTPTRIRFQVPGPRINYSDAVNLVVPDLIDSCNELGICFESLPEMPPGPPGFLIIFGIGLGYHIPLLQESLHARCVIVVDTHVEFLRQSLACVDWQTFLDQMHENGQKFHLVISENREAVLKAIGRIFETEGTMALDGTALFIHNKVNPLIEMHNFVATIVKMASEVRGFFEDECRMLENATANINQYKYHLIDANERKQRRETAIIIGAGPSLQNDLAEIKRIRHSCIVFSSGSALRACLMNGIVPDYHVELENLPETYDSVAVTQKDFSFSGISLLASLTIDPRIPALFQEVLFFFRDTTISSRLLSEHGQILDHSGPMVSNTALRLAAAMGFQKFLLFGVDCGSSTPRLDHVKGTAHDVIPGRHEIFQGFLLDLVVPGNFGGTIHSNTIFLRSAMVLEWVIQSLKLDVKNCSAGLLIKGAAPTRAAGIPEARRPLQRERVKEEISRQLPQYQRSYLVSPALVQKVDTSISSLFSAVSSVVTASGTGGGGGAIWQAIDLEMGRLTAEGNPVVSLIDGTLRSIRQIALPIAVRLTTVDQQQAFDTLCRTRLAMVLPILEKETRRRLGAILGL